MRAEGFFCRLDVLYRGIGISKLQFFITKFLAVPCSVFFSILGHQNPDPDSLEMLDPDSLEMLDPDPQH